MKVLILPLRLAVQLHKHIQQPLVQHVLQRRKANAKNKNQIKVNRDTPIT